MLRRDIETLSMKESDTIDSFFTQVIGLITQIRSHGEILEERRIIEKILRCLPSRFEAVVVAIEETKDLSQFTVDELSVSLMSHEHRLSRGTYSSFEQAFKTQMSFSQRKGRGRVNNRGRGRSQNRGRYYPASTSGRRCNQNQDEGSRKQQAHGQRCPTKDVMNKIPEEAWSDQKQTVTHMRVFGCVAYANVPDQLKKKLDSKGEKCVFIGYCDESKAYKLYNPSTKKLIVSIDV
eukprot:PITA_18759